MINDTVNVVEGEIYDGMEIYDIRKAFKFIYFGDTTSNEVIMDFLELVWCSYFAVIFGFLGSKLGRASAFVYNMRILGFYEVWLMLRENPVYLSGAFVDALIRVTTASLMAGLAQKQVKANSAVQGLTIVTVVSSYSISALDPWFRSIAGCSEKAGPPSTDFPHGAWLDCDDWKIAYVVTWIYAGANYILVGIAGFIAYLIRENPTVLRLAEQVSVAMVATSSATTAARALVRQLTFGATFMNWFADFAYIFVTFYFLFHDAVWRIIQHFSWIQCALNLWQWIIALVGRPLIYIEKIIDMLEEKLVRRGEEGSYTADHSIIEMGMIGKAKEALRKEMGMMAIIGKGKEAFNRLEQKIEMGIRKKGNEVFNRVEEKGNEVLIRVEENKEIGMIRERTNSFNSADEQIKSNSSL